ncbi:Protein ssh4 [Metarhizium acridum]|nr:Protein ssh4 [Metarhizium acridum]
MAISNPPTSAFTASSSARLLFRLHRSHRPRGFFVLGFWLCGLGTHYPRSPRAGPATFVTANPPESLHTDISLSQYLAIQEKGVSAWEFEPELEVANCFVEARTEIEFFDSDARHVQPACSQAERRLLLEAKIYEKPENTLLSIGWPQNPIRCSDCPLSQCIPWHTIRTAPAITTSPLALRHTLRNWSKAMLLVWDTDLEPEPYFFTRNGKRYEEVVHGLKSQNFFPAIGANGPAIVHVNLGQSGFVFIEPIVKKWGLAPVTGSLGAAAAVRV